MEWTDAEAAEEARKGNQSAFRVLVERHSRALFRLAYRMTGNQQDAEDLVQETFLRAYKQLGRFDNRSAFATWLYRICANCSLDLIRSRKRRREQQPISKSGEELNWLDRIAAPSPSPERLTQSGQVADLLEPAMKQLSESEIVASVLHYFEGCAFDVLDLTRGV